jgi:flagellin FlaB
MAKANVFAKLKKNEEAAIGIGTLIIFIALVLVAVIAAVVIINTASDLEQSAQETGSKAKEEVGLAIKVQTFEGQINAAGDEMTAFRIYVTLIGGADATDMLSLILHSKGIDYEGTGSGFSGDFIHADAPNPGGLPTYTVTEITDPHNSYDPTNNVYRLDDDSILRIDIADITVLGGDGLSPLSEIVIEFMLASGGALTKETAETPGSYVANAWMDLA